MAAHTPGPWNFDDHGMIWATTKAGAMMICQVRGWGHLTGSGGLALRTEKAIEVQDANGRMLAAAPELLDVARLVCALFARKNSSNAHADFMGDDEHEAWSAAEAAIRKATGGAA